RVRRLRGCGFRPEGHLVEAVRGPGMARPRADSTQSGVLASGKIQRSAELGGAVRGRRGVLAPARVARGLSMLWIHAAGAGSVHPASSVDGLEADSATQRKNQDLTPFCAILPPRS